MRHNASTHYNLIQKKKKKISFLLSSSRPDLPCADHHLSIFHSFRLGNHALFVPQVSGLRTYLYLGIIQLSSSASLNIATASNDLGNETQPWTNSDVDVGSEWATSFEEDCEGGQNIWQADVSICTNGE